MAAANPRDLELPPVWTQLLSLVVLFLGGGVGGVTLAERLAPGSWLAAVAGLFAFPFAFAIGLQLWLGAALLSALWTLIRRGPAPRPRGRVQFPGGFVFVPVAVLFSTAAGLVIALVGSTLGFFTTLLLYLTLGVIYGIACWRLARGGYLPIPE